MPKRKTPPGGGPPAAKARTLRPFWSPAAEAWSKTLFSPVPKATHPFNEKAWFSSRAADFRASVPTLTGTALWQRIAAAEPPPTPPSSDTSDTDSDEDDDEENPPPEPLKTRTYRLHPTAAVRQTLRQWFGSARVTYNRCVDALKARRVKPTLKTLRADALNADSPALAAMPWLAETPYDVRDDALRDLLKARKTLRKLGKPFDLKFRNKKDKLQTITLHKKHWGKASGVYAAVRQGLRPTEPLPAELPSDARLTMDRAGRFHLHVAVPLDVAPPSSAPAPTDHGVIALDPGVRTFLTGYVPDGGVFEFGRGDMSRITRLCHAYDQLQSKMAKASSRHKYRMRRAAVRLQAKIRHCVDDLHRRTAKTLCKEHRVVLLPVFETQQMVKRAARRLSSKSARAMLTLSHFRFRQHLLHKAREHPWCQVYVVTEEYTSKTCGACGHLHDKLGGNKRFRCPKCNAVFDRDWNAARNILLKFLAAHVPVPL